MKFLEGSLEMDVIYIYVDFVRGMKIYKIVDMVNIVDIVR